MAKASGKGLAWPRGLKETPQRVWWFQHFAALPSRMPLAQVANKLGINYSLARYYVRMFRYEVGDPPEEPTPRRKRGEPRA